MLHSQQVYEDLPIEILLEEGKQSRRVKATKDIPAQSIMLPPCVPKTKTLSVDSTHPWRVPITVSTISRMPTAVADHGRRRIKGKAPDAAVADNSSTPPGEVSVLASGPASAVADSRKTIFSTLYVLPEWTGPKVKEDAGDDEDKEWEWTGDESMHPFWAIRRQTEKQTKPEHPSNMMYKELAFTSVTVGSVMGTAMTATTEVIVPFLTNPEDISSGTELSLNLEEPAKKSQLRNRNWKDQLVVDAKRRKVAKPKSVSVTGLEDIEV